MGLEDLPDLGDRFGPAFNSVTWSDVAYHLARQKPYIVEMAEFGFPGLHTIGYVLGKMKFAFSSRTETRIIYSTSRILDEEIIFSSDGIEEKDFEYHVLERKS